MKTDGIKTREDFTNFLRELAKDFDQNSNKWENKSLGDYLSAMESWTEDMDGYYENMGLSDKIHLEKINWRVFADILMAARIYE